MDIDKSLYMAEFLRIRESVGKLYIYPVRDTLFNNIYDELKPKQQIKDVEEVIEEIEDKTIHLMKKDDQPVFFPDLAELDKDELTMDTVEDIKVVKVSEGMDDSTSKTITFNPTYVPTD